MALPGGISALFLVALCALGLGTILHIVGLATPEWSVNDFASSNTFGLWEGCNQRGCGSYVIKDSKIESCEAFAIIGMVFGGLAVILALTVVILPSMGKSSHPKTPLFTMASALAGFFCILICVIIWGAAIHADISSVASIGYSFGLSLAGGVLLAIGGVLALVGGNQHVS